MNVEHATAARIAGESAPVAVPVAPQRIRVEQHSAAGILWFAGWLFSIGFLELPFWKGLLALVIWPYYLGETLTQLLR
jgi:hypothetical protein